MKKMLLIACLTTCGIANAGAQTLIVDAPPVLRDVRVEQVAFADLNIGNPTGLKALQGRIRSAANRVCVSDNPEPGPSRLETLNCYRHAVSEGNAQIDRVLVARRAGTEVAAAMILIGHDR
jgi:UrcA family protein